MHLSIGLVSAILTAAAFANSNSYAKRQNNDTDYELKKGPLDTPWTEKVGTNPWPEYPRPQLQRTQWKNLNGVWRYRNAGAGDINSPPFGQRLESPVLVPFCLESALSGVMAKDAFYSWYQTNFEVPADWNAGDRVLLNFGAVDYNATVFVNGKNVFNHVGGYWAFTVDVTEHLASNGTNELLVFVHDPTDQGDAQIPLGKQTKGVNHIFYTPCSGIWQTVWLESAPSEYVTKLDVNADMNGKVDVTVFSAGNTSSAVKVELHDPKSNEVVATGTGNTNSAFQFTFDSPDLWTPDTPTLYNLTVTLGDDTIHSYTAFRTVSRGEIDGIQRPLLNGEFIFWFGTLDQGYWPDGLHSPPSREAMVYDLKALKEVGYNMLRKHIKVEPALFYRACDEMGIMLIQDMVALRPSVPNPRSTRPPECREYTPVGTDAAQQAFETQLETMVHQLKNYPSIVSWMIYNEGWGQRIQGYPEYALTEKVRSIDPTRLVNSVSGWHDHGAGDFHDNHKYPYPQCGTPFYSTPSTPYDPKRIAIQGEFGGLGQNVSEENAWKVAASINMVNATYELSDNLEIWNYRTHELLSMLRDQIEQWACSAAVWTQTTDVEGEVNGMLTYDRRINRMDKAQWKADIAALYEAARLRGGAGNKTSTAEFRMMQGA